MPEPVTTIGLGAIAAYLGKDGLEKLLGPTAAYLGDEARDFVQARKETIGKILKNASDKAGNKLDKPGKVPPKVLKTIIDDGSFSSEPLSIDYLGGVLASSRTREGRDDRGARISKIIDRLSTYQLRAHFIIYYAVRELFKNKSLSLEYNDRAKMTLFISNATFEKAMDFLDDELNQIEAILSHTLFGLVDESLIEKHFIQGPQDDIRDLFPSAPCDGLVCTPTAFGAELFMWGIGRGTEDIDRIFDSELCIEHSGLRLSDLNPIAVNDI